MDDFALLQELDYIDNLSSIILSQLIVELFYKELLNKKLTLPTKKRLKVTV